MNIITSNMPMVQHAYGNKNVIFNNDQNNNVVIDEGTLYVTDDGYGIYKGYNHVAIGYNDVNATLIPYNSEDSTFNGYIPTIYQVTNNKGSFVNNTYINHNLNYDHSYNALKIGPNNISIYKDNSKRNTYSLLVGYDNTLGGTGAQYNSVFGQYNDVLNANNMVVSGTCSYIYATNNGFVSGVKHKLVSSSHKTFVNGCSNNIKGYLESSIVSGTNNTAYGSNASKSTQLFVSGSNNVVEESEASIISGLQNTVQAVKYSLIGGWNNNIINVSNSIFTSKSSEISQACDIIVNACTTLVQFAHKGIGGGNTNTIITVDYFMTNGSTSNVKNSQYVISNTSCSNIEKSNHVLTVSNLSTIYNSELIISNGQSNYTYSSYQSIINGENNITGVTSNALTHGVTRGFINGNYNTVTQSYDVTIFGYNNEVNSSYNLFVCGYENNVIGYHGGVILGQYAYLNESESSSSKTILAIGDGICYAQHNAIHLYRENQNDQCTHLDINAKNLSMYVSTGVIDKQNKFYRMLIDLNLINSCNQIIDYTSAPELLSIFRQYTIEGETSYDYIDPNQINMVAVVSYLINLI